jgi:hypothetical protein
MGGGVRLMSDIALSPGPPSVRSPSTNGHRAEHRPALRVDDGDHDLGVARRVEHDPVVLGAAVGLHDSLPVSTIGAAYCGGRVGGRR